MRRHRGLVLLVVVVALVGLGFGVHAAMAPDVHESRASDWRVVGRAPLSPRSFAIITPVGTSVVVFGGLHYLPCPDGAACPAPGSERDGAVYHPRSQTWTPMALAPRDVTNGSWVVVGHTLLLLTGTGRLVGYDVDTDSWKAFPRAPVSVQVNWLLTADRRFAYVADSNLRVRRPMSRVERITLATGRWHAMPSSTYRPRLNPDVLFATPRGLLMAGLRNPDRSNMSVQAEILDNGHWRRYSTPPLHAAFCTLSWADDRLVAAFPSGGGSGQALDPRTGRWSPLARQPDVYKDPSWWEGTFSTSGSRILKLGHVFNASAGVNVQLTQPDGAGPGASVGLTKRGVYVMDNNSKVWWQPL
jgi:hypothetical protein